MAITSIQTVTAGSVSGLVEQVKNQMKNSYFPVGSAIGVQATTGYKTQYFQVVAEGAESATDYDVVISQDRAEFTIKINEKVTDGFQQIGDMSVIQVTPGRTVEYAMAFVKK